MKIFRVKTFSAVIAILCFTQVSLAQSKTDTENWIKTIIEDAEYRYNNYHNYEVNFDNGNMIIKQPWLSENLYQSIIPLKSLGKIKLQKLDDGYRLTLSCTNGKCIKDGKYSGTNLNNYEFLAYTSQTVIMFGPIFENDGLPERLKKALTHLVQLNGGKLAGETF
jgi:hypothetical protein